MLTSAQEWFKRTFVDIFLQLRWSFLPPLMVYFAAGISGLIAIVGTFFVMFTSERGSPFTTAGFGRMVERAGVDAKLGFKAHPHMLRHACGFALANKGHDTRALQAYRPPQHPAHGAIHRSGSPAMRYAVAALQARLKHHRHYDDVAITGHFFEPFFCRED